MPLSLPCLLLWFSVVARAEPTPELTPADEPRGDIAHPQRIDRIIAVVGDRLVTDSDLALERDLGALVPRPTAVQAGAENDPVQLLIDVAIIRAKAGDISVYQPSPADIRARVEALQQSFSSPARWAAFLDRHGLDEGDIAGRLYSRAVVERYVGRSLGAGTASNDAPRLVQASYDIWIQAQRTRVSIRRVPEQPDPSSGDPLGGDVDDE